ncbi:MAG TPA: hypothetical protein ENF16_01175 [Bacteroidetes bacterium]|nr:hypothetical protein [Bacteroidota bacterium]
MILTEVLVQDEGKTLEFKENCRPSQKILQAVVAFANTAGGTLVLGVRDRTKEVVGLSDPLKEEERLANLFADNIRPMLIREIQILSWRDRELIVVTVPHMVGPYFVRTEGPEKGVYIRLGSTNRRAGPEIIAEIQRLAINTFFDEQPCTEVNSEAIDFRAASEFFAQVSLKLTHAKQHSLNLVINHGGREVPTRGAILLFGKNRRSLFPDAVIRCARFRGLDKSHFLDQAEIDEYLPRAVESAVAFVERHAAQASEIGRVRRKEIPEYPPPAIREAIINAIVHADYSIGGMNTNVAVYDDRIEISNPGLLPFGLTLEAALAGTSKLRNRVIGRVFRELKLIEQWGSGMGRMIAACTEAGLHPPRFEEMGTSFRVTLYSGKVATPAVPEWYRQLLKHLAEKHEISTRDAAQLWQISDRAARARLRKLVDQNVLAEIGTGPKDPKKVYVLKGK